MAIAIYSEEDKKKTVAEYLGIVGTSDDIQTLAVNEEAKKLLEDLCGYRFTATDYRDEKGFYPFVYRALMYHEKKKDNDDRPETNLALLTPKTLGELVEQKDTLLPSLDSQRQGIMDDYDGYKDSDYGRKRDSFLESSGYYRSREPDKNSKFYFLRYWRSSVKQLMALRGLDIHAADPRVQDESKEFLFKLFGRDLVTIWASEKGYDSLVADWPEHLVEDKGKYLRHLEDTREREAAQRETLKREAFLSTLVTLIPDAANKYINNQTPENLTELLNAALGNEPACQKLQGLLGTREKLDIQAFKDTLALTPIAIQEQAEMLRKDLIKRNDDAYIWNHAGVTFNDFFIARRPDFAAPGTIGREEAQRNALKSLLGTSIDVDDKAVKQVLSTPCQQLKENPDLVLSDLKSRRRWRRVILTSLSILSAAAVFFSGRAALSGRSESNGPDEAPTAEKTPAKPATTAKEKAKPTPAPVVADKGKDKPASTVADEGKDTPTPAPSMVKKALDRQTETGTAAAPQGAQSKDTAAQQPAAPAEIIGKKGNHLIGLRWSGFRDKDYLQEMEEAPDLLFKTYFDYMIGRIRKTGLPFGDLFKPEDTRKVITKANDYVWMKPKGSKETIRFYIRKGGQARDELVGDILSFHMNCRDVLDNLGVRRENLPRMSADMMEALDYPMGYSTKQQIAWQQMHPEEAKDATARITEMARDTIQKGQLDIHDPEAVLAATIKAAKAYRETHPGNRALLLSLDESVREITGLTREDKAQYYTLEEAEVQKHIAALNQSEATGNPQRRSQSPERRTQYDGTTPTPRGSEGRSSDSSSGGFPWKTTLAIGAIAYLWGRKKRRG